MSLLFRRDGEVAAFKHDSSVKGAKKGTVRVRVWCVRKTFFENMALRIPLNNSRPSYSFEKTSCSSETFIRMSWERSGAAHAAAIARGARLVISSATNGVTKKAPESVSKDSSRPKLMGTPPDLDGSLRSVDLSNNCGQNICGCHGSTAFVLKPCKGLHLLWLTVLEARCNKIIS